MNYGKIFEKEFKESAQKQGIWIMRINDTYVPAKAISEDSFIPQQPCDYVVHYDGTLWLLELKSTEKKYMTIERDGNRGMIKKHQYEQMFQKIGEHEKAMLRRACGAQRLPREPQGKPAQGHGKGQNECGEQPQHV